jgi:hypothetical protein
MFFETPMQKPSQLGTSVILNPTFSEAIRQHKSLEKSESERLVVTGEAPMSDEVAKLI